LTGGTSKKLTGTFVPGETSNMIDSQIEDQTPISKRKQKKKFTKNSGKEPDTSP